MKDSIAKIAFASLLIALSGCISVHERQPDTVSTTTTTRHATVATVPATTTVERTTVY